jgi:nicotinamidase-related amidase
MPDRRFLSPQRPQPPSTCAGVRAATGPTIRSKSAFEPASPVAYGTREQNMSKWLKEVAPTQSDIKIVNTAQDRFYDTDLDKALKSKGIKTLIMVGWKVSGSVTYTSVGAMVHDYTVVIPVDTTSAGSDYETTIGFYNVLNSGNANLANEPLKPKATTPDGHDHLPIKSDYA